MRLWKRTYLCSILWIIRIMEIKSFLLSSYVDILHTISCIFKLNGILVRIRLNVWKFIRFVQPVQLSKTRDYFPFQVCAFM